MLIVNYRPVLIGGILEASYPSSTTMLVMCVMPTAIIQFNARIKNNVLKRFIASVIIAFIVFMVIGRLISGVHWFTDIIGGALLSAGLVLLYRVIISLEVR
jgi:undecaprenyl-diphosphatase